MYSIIVHSLDILLLNCVLSIFISSSRAVFGKTNVVENVLLIGIMFDDNIINKAIMYFIMCFIYDLNS